MSFQDRDWYRDEVRKRERWSHPLSSPPGKDQRQSERSLLVATWIVVIIGAIAVSFAANEYRHRPAEPVTKTMAPPAPLSTPMQGATFVQTAPPSVFEPPETHQVTKCVVAGRVSYSSRVDCQGGSVATVTVNPSRSEIDGGFSSYELEMLESADARSSQQQVSPTAGAISPTVSTIRRSECETLGQQIIALDARSRHPLSAYEQDFIRQERQHATSRQYELRC